MVRVASIALTALVTPLNGGWLVDAFVSTTRSTFAVKSIRGRSFLRMADDEETPSFDRAVVTSQRREIAYDEKSGRFFEQSDSECIPEEEYCAVDKDSGELIRLTKEEKERMYLDTLQSYYFSGRQLLDDDEFDLLKEDLQWSGSSLIEMNRKEAKFLAAMQAYNKGEPMMSDAEYNALKQELKDENSKFAVSTEPKCFIDTGICTVTLQDDSFRTNLLSLPALSILYFTWLVLSFELLHLNPIILTILGAYPIFKGTRYITDELLFPNNRIVYGPCPACEAENRIYFGDILGVEGFQDQATVKCKNCKEQFSVLRSTLRASTLPKA